ncbi:hypothetical protein CBS101457_006571 [Exobasidium rhododendri]|nr:hypothetical protein CBS101457_006571 [Exobasidium rhododendri]
MGRNAKFYKSSKSKKEQSSIQIDVTKPQRLTSRPILSASQGKKRAREADDTVNPPSLASQPPSINPAGASTSRLKSKLWKNLDAAREKEGKKDFATPREAGIDYLGQWEGKRRK